MNKLVRPFVIFAERFYPDPFVFAIGLTGLVFVMCLALTDAGPSETALAWGDGLAGLMAFIAQLSLCLIAAHALAHTDVVQRGLQSLGRAPRNAATAYVMVAVLAALASLIAWSLGLVVGALIARQVAAEARLNGIRLHYPLLVAAAYGGFVVWHMGYSSSVALLVATPGNEMQKLAGGTIPVTETIFASWNLATAAVAVLVLALTVFAIRPNPSKDEIIELPSQVRSNLVAAREGARNGPSDIATLEAIGTSASSNEPSVVNLGERLDRSRTISTVLGAGLAVYLILYFRRDGFDLTIDVVNWSFLCVGLFLSRSVGHYISLITNAAKNVGQIILQFPFYAGIMGMMAGTGLVAILSGWFVQIASPETLGFFTFLSAGVLNIFVPSGGGQWAIQGPIVLEAARSLGVDPSRVVMGVAYGDQWTNMIQPFWSIPLLAIAGLKMREIMGYTVAILVTTGAVFGCGLLLAGPG